MIRFAALLVLAGCSSLPISETPIPATELARCQALSEQHSILPRAAVRAGIGAGVGVAAQSALGHAALTGTTSVMGASAATTSTFTVPHLIVPLAVLGAVFGAIEASDRREAIVRECLRDRGFKAY